MFYTQTKTVTARWFDDERFAGRQHHHQSSALSRCMDFELTEEQRAFADAAREFARREFAPHAARWDARKHFPKEAIAKAGELGFCGLYAPEAHRRPGSAAPRRHADLRGDGRGRTRPPRPSSRSTTWRPGCSAPGASRPCASAVGADARQRAQAGVLLPDRAGRRAPTPARSRRAPKRRATTTALNGSKAFISGAGATDVLVRHGAHRRRAVAGGISAFAVPARCARHQLRQEGTQDGLEQPAHAHHQLRQRRGAGRESARRGRRGLQHRDEGARRRAHQHRDLLGRHGAGRARCGARATCTSASSSAKRSRSFQALQFKLADMATELVAARQMVRLAACKLDAGVPTPAPIARWPSASPPTSASTSATRRCSCTAATATSSELPAGTARARRARAPDPRRHQRNHARDRRAAVLMRRRNGGDSR